MKRLDVRYGGWGVTCVGLLFSGHFTAAAREAVR